MAAENIVLVTIINKRNITSPASHTLNDVVRNVRDEKVSGTTGAERMTGIVLGYQTDTIGGGLNTRSERIVGDGQAPIKASGPSDPTTRTSERLHWRWRGRGIGLEIRAP